MAEYEVVRAYALGAGQGGTIPRGLGVIRRRGLPAWIAAWTAPDLPAAVGHPQLGTSQSHGIVPMLPSEAVQVLATMALAHWTEVQP